MLGDIKEAVRQQERIGFHMMAQGYIVKGWKMTMTNRGVKKLDRKMNQLQLLMWKDYSLFGQQETKFGAERAYWRRTEY